MKTAVFVRHINWCESCQKRSYLTRPMAKDIARKTGGHRTAYPCPVNVTLWHVGRLPRDVIEGKITRHEYYGGKEGSS